MMTREIMVHSFVKVLCSHKRHALQGYVMMTCVYENGIVGKILGYKDIYLI